MNDCGVVKENKSREGYLTVKAKEGLPAEMPLTLRLGRNWPFEYGEVFDLLRGRQRCWCLADEEEPGSGGDWSGLWVLGIWHLLRQLRTRDFYLSCTEKPLVMRWCGRGWG